MIHPHTELRHINDAIGHGVVATAPIPRGTIAWVRDPLDRLLTPEEVAALPAACTADLERYTWQDRDGNLILCWDLARFVNHSCEPNCLATPYGFEIVIRDIGTGEQMTNDYANLGLQPQERVACYCGSPRCRELIVPADAARLAATWAEPLRLALQHIGAVPQPLSALIQPADLQRAHACMERALP